MCSIEEAWAGQNFDGYRVQSQADLRRKYMPISDDMLTRNNEFTVTKKEPASRMANQGINTKMVRPTQVATPTVGYSNTEAGMNGMGMNISFAENNQPMDNYGGLDPRPGYMSIYDNAGQGLPMPTQTQAQPGRSDFGDINQAFQVSPTVDRFMSRSNNNSNHLLNDNSNDDQLVLYKKFNSSDRNNTNDKQIIDTNIPLQSQVSQIQASLKNILFRLESVEGEIHNSGNRNMYDMVLYILVGMLIAFIFYSLLRK